MTVFDVAIHETYIKHVLIEADDEDDAYDKVEAEYQDGGIIVNDPDNFIEYELYSHRSGDE